MQITESTWSSQMLHHALYHMPEEEETMKNKREKNGIYSYVEKVAYENVEIKDYHQLFVSMKSILHNNKIKSNV